jgi:hypothetical protein
MGGHFRKPKIDYANKEISQPTKSINKNTHEGHGYLFSIVLQTIG